MAALLNHLRRLRCAALICLPVFSTYGDDRISYDRHVAPLLAKHCTHCHGSEEQESGLRLDSSVHALRGGNSGEPAVVPGHAARSDLIVRIASADAAVRMPPDEDRLSSAAIDLLKAWINQADLWTDAADELAEARLQHWSFQPLVRPSVPDAGPPHPVDAFIAQRLQEADLNMSERASRRTRIRRLFLVMHGLPPTPDRVQEFLGDQRPAAWECLVDEVIAGPHYGERWSTYWLDLIRFAETDGFETNRERPHAWPYRDWVIHAFNADKPYNQFVMEQLAGDALGEDAATGFLVAGPHDIVKGRDKQLGLLQRQDELDGIINATGATFLGLTVGCARCHNHKFDPILQKDYYSLQAVFAGVTYANRPLSPSPPAIRQIQDLENQIEQLRVDLQAYGLRPQRIPVKPPISARLNNETFPAVSTKFVRFVINRTSGAEPCLDELEVFAGDSNVGLASAGATAQSSGDFVHPLHKLQHINDGKYGNPRSWIASNATGAWVQIQLPDFEVVDRIVWSRDRLGIFSDRLAAEYAIQLSPDGRSWQTVASSAERRPNSSDKESIDIDTTSLDTETAKAVQQKMESLKLLLARRGRLTQEGTVWGGRFQQPGPTHRLYRGDPQAVREQVSAGAVEALSRLSLPADALEQSRRLALAEWIADPQNPLTARVMVNRIWQHHFGNGIVSTASDFGRNGVPPTHPRLLDWLAAEFIDNGWSVKHLQKLILTSHTWQQDSKPRTQGMATDAGSRLLWRFPHRRLDAGGIRDSVLAVSGRLNDRPGGPGFSAFEVAMENVRHYFPKTSYGQEDWRRMIYMTKVRQERDAVFGTFDCPDFSSLVAKRSLSTTPLQAMGLLNSHFMMEQAQFVADRLTETSDNVNVRIRTAWELCFSRPPAAAELAVARQAVARSGWREFARAMLNANEFVFIP